MKVTELLREKIKGFPEGFVFSYDNFGIDADKEIAIKKLILSCSVEFCLRTV